MKDQNVIENHTVLSSNFLESCFNSHNGIIVLTGENANLKTHDFVKYISNNDTIIKGTVLTYEKPLDGAFETPNFDESAALRQYPALTILGELNQKAVLEAAIDLSSKGHHVIATVKSHNVLSAIKTLANLFPVAIRFEKMIELFENMKSISAQATISTLNDERIFIEELLATDKDFNKSLVENAKNIDDIYELVKTVLNKNEFGSVSYKSQLDYLFESKLISADDFEVLTYHLASQ